MEGWLLLGAETWKHSPLLSSGPHGVSYFMQEKASSNPILDPTPQAALLASPKEATAATRESSQLPF